MARVGRSILDRAVLQSQDFQLHKILTATSFAALTYIGVDGVTTLAEDVENPKRNVLLAVVLTCIFARDKFYS
jgi:putrescine importer